MRKLSLLTLFSAKRIVTYVFSRPRHLKERNEPEIVKTFHLSKTEVNESEPVINVLSLSSYMYPGPTGFP